MKCNGLWGLAYMDMYTINALEEQLSLVANPIFRYCPINFLVIVVHVQQTKKAVQAVTYGWSQKELGSRYSRVIWIKKISRILGRSS